jgi:tripartite-type tricarboxylate transporter receptor subunit TctC
VPYKGGTPMLTDLAGGFIDFSIDQLSSALNLIQDGRIKGLAVTSRQRSKLLPQLKTLDESLLPGFVMAPWFCVGAPAGTPPEAVKRVNAALNRMLKNPDALARLEKLSIDPVGGSPEDFAALIQQEAALMRELVARVDLKAS